MLLRYRSNHDMGTFLKSAYIFTIKTLNYTSSYFLFTNASLNLNSVGSMLRTLGLASLSRQYTLFPLILVMQIGKSRVLIIPWSLQKKITQFKYIFYVYGNSSFFQCFTLVFVNIFLNFIESVLIISFPEKNNYRFINFSDIDL